MRKSILIAGIAICIICAALISYGFIKFTQRDAIPSRDLTLSEYPQLFAKEAVIVLGDNASQIEKESAEAIAVNLENLTGNKPEIINTEKIESFKYSYNLIIVGTPKSNEILEEVHNMTDAIRVTDEYPGENKGVLEILNNPWNEEKAILLVEGSDEWGVKAGSVVLTKDETIDELHEGMIVTNGFIKVTGRIRVIGNEPFTQVVIDTSEGVYGLTGDKAKKHGPLWKLQGETVEIQGFLQGRTPPSFRTEKSIDIIELKEIKNLGGDKK